MISFMTLLACTDKESSTEDTTYRTPEIWGFDTLEDINPDPNIVEVNLTADVISKVIGSESVPNVWAYNGSTPGPLLQAKKGDQVIVNFTNNLDTPTTIHWHGLRIPDYMDGTPMMQSPIEPGETFTYDFVVPDSGTYWYHPHMRSDEAVERGLQGPIIIHDEGDPTVDKERMFVIDDLYLNDNGVMGTFAMNRPNSVHGRYGNVLMTNGQNILEEPLTDTVRPKSVERWRLVNTANARTIWVDIDGAAWRVIAIDGTTLEEPYKTETIMLPVGRRFDVEVIPDAAKTEVSMNMLVPNQSGRLVPYPAFVAPIEGEEGSNAWKEWPTDELPTASMDVEQEVELVLNGAFGDDGLAHWTINGESFGEHTPIVVQGNTPSIIRIINESTIGHPYHLHGEFFQILERETGEMLPGQMDTLFIEPEETVSLWTNFTNPGRWMSHCHILEHAEQGMMGEIVVE